MFVSSLGTRLLQDECLLHKKSNLCTPFLHILQLPHLRHDGEFRLTSMLFERTQPPIGSLSPWLCWMNSSTAVVWDLLTVDFVEFSKNHCNFRSLREMLRSSDPRISGWINPETTFRASKECLWPHGDNDLVHTLPASEWWSSCADWWPNCRHFSWEEKTTSPWRSPEMMEIDALQEANISPQNGSLKMIFLFPRWDMLIPWRVLVLDGTLKIRTDVPACYSQYSLCKKCGVFFFLACRRWKVWCMKYLWDWEHISCFLRIMKL